MSLGTGGVLPMQRDGVAPCWAALIRPTMVSRSPPVLTNVFRSEFRIRAKLTTDPGIPCMGEGMQCWSWDISLRDMSAHIRAGCVSRGVALCWAALVHDGVAAIEGCSVLGPRPCPGKVALSTWVGLSSPVFSKRLGFVRGWQQQCRMVFPHTYV